MVNERRERLEVLEPCLKLCKKLKIAGYILKYRRLDALDYYHENGDPDIEIWFSDSEHLCILMVECKSNKGKLSPAQILCKDKYKKYNNVKYMEVRDVKQLKDFLYDRAVNINF